MTIEELKCNDETDAIFALFQKMGPVMCEFSTQWDREYGSLPTDAGVIEECEKRYGSCLDDWNRGDRYKTVLVPARGVMICPNLARQFPITFEAFCALINDRREQQRSAVIAWMKKEIGEHE